MTLFEAEFRQYTSLDFLFAILQLFISQAKVDFSKVLLLTSNQSQCMLLVPHFEAVVRGDLSSLIQSLVADLFDKFAF